MVAGLNVDEEGEFIDWAYPNLYAANSAYYNTYTNYDTVFIPGDALDLRSWFIYPGDFAINSRCHIQRACEDLSENYGIFRTEDYDYDVGGECRAVVVCGQGL